jgi:hypothetical protein
VTNISGRYKQKNFEAECVFCQHQQQQLEKQTLKSLESIQAIQWNLDFTIPDFTLFLELGPNNSNVRPTFIFLNHNITVTEQELCLSLSHALKMTTAT